MNYSIDWDGPGEKDRDPPETVTIPLELLCDLWRYGNLAPVDGVMYGASHRERLRQADEAIRQAYGWSR